MNFQIRLQDLKDDLAHERHPYGIPEEYMLFYALARRVVELFENCPYCEGTNKLWGGASLNPPILGSCGHCIRGMVASEKLREVINRNDYGRGGITMWELIDLLFGEDTR